MQEVDKIHTVMADVDVSIMLAQIFEYKVWETGVHILDNSQLDEYQRMNKNLIKHSKNNQLYELLYNPTHLSIVWIWKLHLNTTWCKCNISCIN